MKFLFCPLSSYGFVYPSIGIAKELKRRGHEIAFVTGNSFSKILESEDLERIPNGRGDKDSFLLKEWADPHCVRRQVDHIRFGLEKFAPNALVGTQLGFGSLLAAEMYGLPVSVIGACVYLWATKKTLEQPRSSWNSSERIAVWRMRPDLYNWSRIRLRLPLMDELDAEETPLLGDIFLLQNLPHLIDNAEDLPGRVHFVGPCNWDPTIQDVELEEWLKRARVSGYPILYVQPGSHFDERNFWPYLIDALAEKAIWVVASVGRMVGKEGSYPLETYPGNFLVREHISQGNVIRYVNGVVTMGNTSAVLGALTHGVPLLLIPTGGEQVDCAKMCLRNGVCVGVNPKHVSVKTMAEATDELIRRSDIRNSARKIKEVFSSNNGPKNAADLIEALDEKRSARLTA